MIDVAGISSCKSSSRFLANSVVNTLMPVTLPPGRLRLLTRPNLTGSSPTMNTIGIVLVAAFAAKPRDVSSSSCDHGHSARNQIGGKPSKSIIPTVRPTVFDRNILTLDISSLVQTTSESSDVLRRLPSDLALSPRRPASPAVARSRRSAEWLPRRPECREIPSLHAHLIVTRLHWRCDPTDCPSQDIADPLDYSRWRPLSDSTSTVERCAFPHFTNSRWLAENVRL